MTSVLINRHLASLMRTNQAPDLVPTVYTSQILRHERNQTKANEQVRPKKFFAVHIGPSKTGTSAIQRNGKRNPFEENTFAPDKDNLIYVGKRTGEFDKYKDEEGKREIRRAIPIGTPRETVSITPKNERTAYTKATSCMISVLDEYYESFSNSTIDESAINEQLETNYDTRASLRQAFIDRCWIITIEGKGKIDFSYMLDSSILDSDEAYSYPNRGDPGKKFRLFDILGYETLVVVGAYRRYADWLVSAYTQSMKKSCLEKSLNGDKKNATCKGFKSFLQKHMKRRGSRKYQLRQAYDPVSVTLPEYLQSGPSKLQAKILNYFQLPHSPNAQEHLETSRFKAYNSITTELYCDALGDNLTPHTCNHAQSTVRKDTSKKSALIANKGDFSDSVYRRIVAQGYIVGFLLLTDQELEERKENCKADDVIWCDAVKRCLTEKKCNENTKLRQKRLDAIGLGRNAKIIGTNSSNVATFRDLSNYHVDVHKKRWTDNLPIKCVGKTLLEELLQKSLAFEEMVMPDFYASSLGKDEHIRLFWDVWLKEKKHFCTVDTARLFQGATSWDEIINERMVSSDWGEPTEWYEDD